MADVITLDEIEQLKSVVETGHGEIKSIIEIIKTNTSVNNTASETGTLSQKLSSLIAMNKNHGSLERTTAGSQNWTCPNGVYSVYLLIQGGTGGGGGGGGVSNSYWKNVAVYGGGSGGVGDAMCYFLAVDPGTTYALTVGSGGSGGAGGSCASTPTGGGNGGAGGQSKFGNIVVCNGGGGGLGGSPATWSDDTNQKDNDIFTGGAIVKSPITNPLISIINSIEGIDGKTGIKSGIGAAVLYGVNGANYVTGGFNKKSGAGGASGKIRVGGSQGDTTPTGGASGSSGQPGYIKIVW